MKKVLGLLVAVLLVAGFAGQAFATFQDADTELYRVVYNTTYNGAGQPNPQTGTYDIITDLGNVNTLIGEAAGGPVTVGNGVDAFTNFQGFGSTVPLNTLQVTYFAVDYTNNYAWISGSSSTKGLKSFGSSFDSFAGGAQGAVLGSQGPVAGTSTLAIQQSKAYSFAYVEEGGTTGPIPGTFSDYIQNGGNAFLTEASLATLAPGSPIAMYLNYFSNGYASQTGQLHGIEVLTNSNGSTTIEEQPATVPIPAGLFLLAPGLLGLFGIRKRIA